MVIDCVGASCTQFFAQSMQICVQGGQSVDSESALLSGNSANLLTNGCDVVLKTGDIDPTVTSESISLINDETADLTKVLYYLGSRLGATIRHSEIFLCIEL